MESWEKEDGIYVEIDIAKASTAFDLLKRQLPAYENLVIPEISLTSQDIISLRAEHGRWWAREYEYINENNELELREVGVAATWTSDSHPLGGEYNPCYVAMLSIGYPGSDISAWSGPYTDEVACVYVPERDINTGEYLDDRDLLREAYEELVDTLINLS